MPRMHDPMALRDRKKKDILNLYLEEYKSLRQELTVRLQTYNQAFHYLLLVIGAATAAVAAVIPRAEPTRDLTPLWFGIALLLPIVTAPLAFVQFHQEMMMDAIRAYLGSEWRDKTEILLGARHSPGNTYEYVASPRLFRALLTGRWIIFLVPTCIPFLLLSTYILGNVLASHDLFQMGFPVASGFNHLIVGLCVYLLLIVDAIVVSNVLRVVFWAWRKYAAIEHEVLGKVIELRVFPDNSCVSEFTVSTDSQSAAPLQDIRIVLTGRTQFELPKDALCSVKNLRKGDEVRVVGERVHGAIIAKRVLIRCPVEVALSISKVAWFQESSPRRRPPFGGRRLPQTVQPPVSDGWPVRLVGTLMNNSNEKRSVIVDRNTRFQRSDEKDPTPQDLVRAGRISVKGRGEADTIQADIVRIVSSVSSRVGEVGGSQEGSSHTPG
jgi:hypothetical protein